MIDPSRLHRGALTRAATFENPTAAPGGGGRAGAGRKGAPSRVLAPGERVRLAEVEGPGRVTHLWATFAATDGATSPAVARSQLLEVSYAEVDAPSISVPAPDLFGAVHGIRTPYASALTAVNEGRGYTSRMPMPFAGGIAIDWENRSRSPVTLYYQVDLLLGAGTHDAETGFLHATFRRENPTAPGTDFTITDGLEGPGRFLGMTGGVRVLEPERWWGEGEVKIYVDGDTDLPTVCGTGTEDYLDSAWGLGTFAAPETGAPAVFAAEGEPEHHHRLVSFYRWHLSDPVVFDERLRVTIQQIGASSFGVGQEAEWEAFRAAHQPAAGGWPAVDRLPVFALYERSDDWCATAFTYCARPQVVAPCALAVAIADLPETRRGLRLVLRR
ncbi:MAG TPA: glycoside hydrolase family 172 protein [Acidimicrobiales bacterium]|nr:glycoside hydrolase family 172 protein [Acidimicrobiales bacterium]